MRVLVIGVTGRVGSAALAACLEKNHTVTALVRNLSKLPVEILSHPRVHAVKGEPTSHASLVDTIRDQDAVIQASAYSSNSSNITNSSCGISDQEAVIRCIIGAIEEVQASRRKRLLGGGIRGGKGGGNGGSGRERPIRLWVLSGEVLKEIPGKMGAMRGDVIPINPKYYKDYAFLRQEASDVDWSLLCPGQIEMGEVRVLLYECR